MEFNKWLSIKTNLSMMSVGQYTYWANKMVKDVYNIWDEKEVLTYLLRIKRDYKPNSTKVIFSAVKMYMTFLEQSIDIPKNPKRGESKTLAVSEEQIRIITNEYINESIYKSRLFKSTMCIMFYTGLRASELINLKVSDIKEDNIIIKGKNLKVRVIPIFKCIKKDIEYLKYRNNIFLVTKESGEKITYSWLHNVIENIKNELSLDKKITLHSFRRGYATMLFRSGLPLNMISKLLGHKSIATTEIYLKYDITDITKKLKKMNLID